MRNSSSVCSISLELHIGGPFGIRHTYLTFVLHHTAHSAPQLYTLYPRRKHSLTPIVMHTADAVSDKFLSTVQIEAVTVHRMYVNTALLS